MSASQCTLEDLLHELSIPAADALFDSLQVLGSLSDARLVSHALRAAVDGSLRSLRIRVHGRRLEWEAESGPRLDRWPRCQELICDIQGDDLRGSEPATNDMMLIAKFLGTQTPEIRRRITSLVLLPLFGYSSRINSCSALAALLRCCPELRSLEMQHSIPGDAAGHLILSGLAALPSFQHLTLACPEALPHVASLLNSLRTLTLDARHSRRDAAFLTPAALEALSGLRVLQELTLRNFSGEGASAGAALLDALPRSTQRLYLEEYQMNLTADGGWFTSAMLDLQAGQLTSVLLHCGDRAPPELSDIAALVGSLVLPSRTLGPRLPRLQLGLVHAERRRRGMTDEAAEQQQLAPLRELVRRCDQVGLQALVLSYSSDLDAALRVVEVLGAMPRQVVARVLSDVQECQFVLRVLPEKKHQAAAAATAGPSCPAAVRILPPPRLLPRAEAAAAANEAKEERAATAAVQAAAVAGVAARSLAVDVASPWDSAALLRSALRRLPVASEGRPSRLITLQGRAVVELARQIPRTRQHWGACLQERARDHPPGPSWAVVFDSPRDALLESVQVVRAAGVLLLSCQSKDAAAQVISAVSEAVAGGAPEDAVEVVPVADAWARWALGSSYGPALTVCSAAMQQVMQEEWDREDASLDPDEHDGAARRTDDVVRQRLEQLLAVMAQLGNLPKYFTYMT